MDDSKANIPEWFKGGENKISLYSSVRIVRNFRAINFPSAGDHNSFRQVEKKADAVLAELIKKGTVLKYDIAAMEQSEIIRLQKFRILPARRNDVLTKMKLYHHTFLDTYLILNYIDHLTFFAHTEGSDIRKAYNKCIAMADIFRNADMSMDEHGNYHTAALDYFGTGLKCFSVLTIPAVRLFGDINGLILSLKTNRIATKSFFSLDGYDMTIISNVDSVSKNSDEIVSDFGKILEEIEKISDMLTVKNNEKTDELKLRCSRIINYDFLTFSNFMEIYHILSFIILTGQCIIPVTELNEQVGFVVFDSPRSSLSGGLKRSVTGSLVEKINKILKKEELS